MCLVLGLRFDSKVAEALVGVVVANEYLHVDSDKSGCPTISVCLMFFVCAADLLYYLFSIHVPRRGLSVLPFIITCSAHTHQFT